MLLSPSQMVTGNLDLNIMHSVLLLMHTLHFSLSAHQHTAQPSSFIRGKPLQSLLPLFLSNQKIPQAVANFAVLLFFFFPSLWTDMLHSTRSCTHRYCTLLLNLQQNFFTSQWFLMHSRAPVTSLQPSWQKGQGYLVRDHPSYSTQSGGWRLLLPPWDKRFETEERRWGRGWETTFLEKTIAAMKHSGANGWEGSQPPGAK